MAEFALSHSGVSVYGTTRTRSSIDNIKHILHEVSLIECDLKDPFSVKDLVEKTKPDRIFHLAGQSFVPASWNAPQETLTTNILSELNLFEAVRQAKIPARIQIACSSEEYGLVYPEEIYHLLT
ncbi:MAG: GDP-mannose 4,6-dehydratase, partial [Firmicutes bacterium HGW-Firmicutes-12]